MCAPVCPQGKVFDFGDENSSTGRNVSKYSQILASNLFQFISPKLVLLVTFEWDEKSLIL